MINIVSHIICAMIGAIAGIGIMAIFAGNKCDECWRDYKYWERLKAENEQN